MVGLDIMDVLSDILDAFHLTGVLYFRAEFSAPFGIAVPAHPNVARFHICLHGDCAITVDGVDEPQWAREGDLFVVPHGIAHTISDRPGRPGTEQNAAMAQAGFDGEGSFVFGGGGAPAVLVCGHFAFEEGIFHPLLDALPPLLHFPAGRPTRDVWLDDAMRLLGDEARVDRPGSAAVVSRLAELLFIQVLRAWVETAGDRALPVAGIRDQQIGRALRQIHEQPGHAWTVADLARKAGMSRTTFAERFHRLVGISPIQYLTQWRIEKAKTALRCPTIAVAEVAEALGYQSEAAFSRAFKKHVGVAPGTFRAAEASR